MSENQNIPDEDQTTSFEVDRTVQMPTSEGEDAGVTELLPELNFDPADRPSAFDPRVTGESDGPQAPVSSPADAETGAAETPSAGPTQAEPAPDEAPNSAPLPRESASQHDPFANAGFTPQKQGIQPPVKDEDAEHSVKFGLLTWALTLIAVGALITSMPWWHLFNWPMIGTVGLTVMGLIMLITAAIAGLKEKKSKMW